jgi:hypothetical protein
VRYTLPGSKLSLNIIDRHLRYSAIGLKSQRLRMIADQDVFSVLGGCFELIKGESLSK